MYTYITIKRYSILFVTLWRLLLNNRIIKAITTYNPFIAAADHELLEMLKDSSLSMKAFEEFYSRFKDYVLFVCRKCCSAFDHSNQLADDIFQETFLKVLHKGHQFHKKNDSKESYTPEIKAWLSRIAKNELINFLRKNPDESSMSMANRIKSETLVDTVAVESETSSEAPAPPTMQQHILEKALASLNETEKTVLMTYMLYYNSSTPNNHLPDDVIKNLTSRLGIKSATLRQIKSRALQKMIKIKTQFSINN